MDCDGAYCGSFEKRFVSMNTLTAELRRLALRMFPAAVVAKTVTALIRSSSSVTAWFDFASLQRCHPGLHASTDRYPVLDSLRLWSEPVRRQLAGFLLMTTS